MIACRTSTAIALLLALAGSAAAQEQPAPPPATGAPTPLETAPPPQDYKPGMFAKPAPIATDQLGIVDGPPVGLLDNSNGGLGESMWSNSPRADVEELLGRLPIVSADPFVRGLSRRLVLTTSDAPVGPAKRALVTIRIEKLLQAGMIDQAGALAASLSLQNDADFSRVQADALLYAGRVKDVCSDLTATRLSSPEPFWLELRDWCFAASGDSASAELTHAVMDAQGIKDPAFDLLAEDVLKGKKSAPADIDHPTALHIYLLRQAGLPVIGPLAAKLGTVANLFAARDARNSAADRLLAAGRIAATGALSSDELVAILDAQTYAPDELAQAQANAAKAIFLAAQGQLRRAATLETRPPEKTDLLLAALSGGGRMDRLPLTAALQSDVALTIKPDPTTAKGRFLIARALVLDGKYDAAEAWYAHGADEADLHAFQILIDIAAPNAARDAAAQAALSWYAHSAAPQQNPAPVAALALGFSDVLGLPMPPAAKTLAGTLEGMRWPGRRQAETRKLAEAASQPGRKGEAVLRLLDMVGDNGPFDLPADIAVECVRTLMQLGMVKEARALAVESLALAGAPLP